MNFLGGVNHILRVAGILRGDDDELTAFTQTQHIATGNIAQKAIQSELRALIADRLIPYEKTSGSIATVAAQRSYTAAGDFVRFWGKPPILYNAASTQRMVEYKGGENALRVSVPDYKTAQGQETWWYWDNTTTKKIALYPIPQSAGNRWDYEYEKSVTVGISTDTLPFHTEDEAQAFCDMAAQRFRYIFENKSMAQLYVDPLWIEARTALFNLLRPTDPDNYYGYEYCSEG